MGIWPTHSAGQRQLTGGNISQPTVNFWPVSARGRRPTRPASELYLSLLCHFQSVVYLNAEVPDRALELGVSKKELDCPQILGAPVDQGRLRAPQGVRPVAGPIQTELSDPGIYDSSVLAGRQVR